MSTRNLSRAGRPAGARNRLAKKVFEDIFAHWTEESAPGSKMCKGQAALQMLYKLEPGAYLRLTTSVLPKEFTFEHAMSELNDEDIDGLLVQLRERMLHLRAEKVETVPQLEAPKEIVNGHCHAAARQDRSGDC